MKKLSILIATILVFALTVSSLAASFTDISSSAWYYEAVQKLVATGIIEGYPDGTFRPDVSLPRKQIALITTRLLDVIEDKDQAIKEEIGADIDQLYSGLTAGQAKEVKTLFGLLTSDSLTETQTEEVQELIESLTSAYVTEEEVSELNASVSEINDDIESIQEDIDQLYSGLTAGQAKEVKTLFGLLSSDSLTETQTEEVQELIESLTSEYITEEEVSELDDDIESIQEEIDFLYSGLTAGQAKEVKLLINNLSPEGLTDEQKDQVTSLVESITDQKVNDSEVDEVAALFEEEVADLQSRIKELEQDLQVEKQMGDIRYYNLDKVDEELQAQVDELQPVFQFKTPSYGLSFEETVTTGGVAYKDPYNLDFNDDGDVDGDDQFADEEFFKQSIDDLGFTIDKGNELKADISFDAVIEDFFVGNDEVGFNIDNLSGTVEAGKVSATIDSAQNPYIRDYLFYNDDDEDPVNGIVADVDGDTYIIGADTAGSYLAGETSVSGINVAVGVENVVGPGGNTVVGLDTSLDLAGFRVKPELAVSDKALAERLFRLDVSRGSMGPVNDFNFKFANDSGLDVIKADAYDVVNGYEISGGMDIANLTVKYENYEVIPGQYVPALRIDADKEIAGIANTFDYDLYTQDAASRMQYTGEKGFDIGGLGVTGSVDWISYKDEATFDILDDAYGDEYDDSDTFDKTVALDYSIAGIDTTASWTHNIDGLISEKYTAAYDVTEALSTSATIEKDFGGTVYEQEYAADYEQGIIVAGLTKYVNQEDNATEFVASVNNDRTVGYDVMGITFSPYLRQFGYRMDDTGSYTNLVYGIDADKRVSRNITLDANFERGSKEFGDNTLLGDKEASSVGLTYDITDSVSTNLSYENVDFVGADPAESYTAERAVGTFSIDF